MGLSIEVRKIGADCMTLLNPRLNNKTLCILFWRVY